VTEWPSCAEFDVGEIVRLREGVDSGLDLPTEEWPRLGNAIHAFFAADDEELDEKDRLAMATALVSSADLSKCVSPEALLRGADALRNFIHSRWPECRVKREIPVLSPVDEGQGQRMVHGSIDMLIESAAGYVVIDHKTFPASGESVWKSVAREHGSQLMAYLRALSRIPGVRTSGAWFHFVMSGAMVEVLPSVVAPSPALP
jgi:ATP-dependent exoDNAse (exonuclease V) beta subunit